MCFLLRLGQNVLYSWALIGLIGAPHAHVHIWIIFWEGKLRHIHPFLQRDIQHLEASFEETILKERLNLLGEFLGEPSGHQVLPIAVSRKCPLKNALTLVPQAILHCKWLPVVSRFKMCLNLNNPYNFFVHVSKKNALITLMVLTCLKWRTGSHWCKNTSFTLISYLCLRRV